MNVKLSRQGNKDALHERLLGNRTSNNNTQNVLANESAARQNIPERETIQPKEEAIPFAHKPGHIDASGNIQNPKFDLDEIFERKDKIPLPQTVVKKLVDQPK